MVEPDSRGESPHGAAREIEEHALAMLDMAFDSSFEVDEHARITAWGVRAERVFGWLESDVLGKPVDTIISPNHRDSFLQALRPAIALREKTRFRS